MKIKTLNALGLAIGIALLPNISLAEGKEQMLLDILLQNGSITKAQHMALSKEFAQPDTGVSEAQTEAIQEVARTVAEAEIAKAKSDPKGSRVVIKDGIGFESNDGQFSLNVGGRVQADAAVYDDDQRPIGDGSTLRRARLAIQGTLYKDWFFKGEYDFARNVTGVADAFLRYSGFKPFALKSNITIGNSKIPFSLEDMMSANDITFLERAIPIDALTPALRRVGVTGDISGKRWSFATGAFGETISSTTGNSGDFGPTDESDSGLSLASRVTALPWLDGVNLIHVGAAVEYRDAGSPTESFRFSRGPESAVTQFRLVDTGNLTGLADFVRYGGELATVVGPFSLQGEYIALDATRETGPDFFLDGWYVQGSWFLTGESRPYDVARGIFTGVKPENSFGAFELALRYSTIDLNHGLLLGGETDLVAAGINWYLNKRLRFSMNYIHVLDTEDPNTPTADGDEPSLVTARAQVAF